MGSIGRRVGDMYCGREDFSVVYPSFETDLTVSVEGEALRKGSFENTVIYNEYLPTADGVSAWAAYSSFCGGDTGLQIITNNNSANDKKILLLRNSYGGAVSPYLSLICKELHIIDLRHYSGISVLEYAKQMQADDVVFIYSRDAVKDTFFNFFSDIDK